MTEERPVYQKYNSFSGFRSQSRGEDVLPRIATLQKTLQSADLPPERMEIIEKACQDLLAPPDRKDSAERFQLHPNVAEEIQRLSDEELARYLFYRYRYEMYPQQKILDKFPPLLQIEPTSICNYRCVFCYQTDKALTSRDSRQMGAMSLDLFKRIIDQAAGACDGLTLASRGEPLSCPSIKEMLAYLRGKFLACKINTNAWFLDEAKSHAILEAGIQTLVFSADSTSEPTYSQFRVGGQLDRILKNIQHFREIRLKHYPQSRLITRVSGVKVPGTPDLDTMEKFWGEYVDQVAFVQYNPWENTYEAPVNDVTTPCSDLWRRMFIWWDGTVNPCDVDYLSKLQVGSIQDQGLSDLWRSSRYEQLRQRHLVKQRSACFPCQRCTVI